MKAKPKFNQISEEIKYRLVERLFIFYFFGISASVVFILFSKEILPTPNIMAVILFGLCIGFLRISKNYRLVSIFSTSAAFLILSYTFLAIKASQFLSPLWMFLNIIFSFLIVGKRWGIGVLIAHFSVYLYFTVHVNINNIVLPSHFSRNDTVSFIIQLCVISFSLAYILLQYLKAIDINESELKETNTVLVDKNALISKQNEEMDLMVREIHHRVKNNLQIISSLLRLQAENNAANPQACSFKEAINRINAMAMIHEKMYQTDSLSQFDIQKYIFSLSDSILENRATQIKPSLHVEVLIGSLQSKTIVPLALLLNELITNSLKHAFSNQKHPEISIKISSESSSPLFQLMYSDNGTWKEDSLPNFGSDIIETMCKQLEGNFQLHKTEQGSRYEFELKHAVF